MMLLSMKFDFTCSKDGKKAKLVPTSYFLSMYLEIAEKSIFIVVQKIFENLLMQDLNFRAKNRNFV